MLARDLRAVHEYEADKAVLDLGIDATRAQADQVTALSKAASAYLHTHLYQQIQRSFHFFEAVFPFRQQLYL